MSGTLAYFTIVGGATGLALVLYYGLRLVKLI
jgi:Cytochrome B6-F complex subunit VI (PetL)